MSLFRQLKTAINDQLTLVDSLKRMGYNPCVGMNLPVRGDRTEQTGGYNVVLKKEHTKYGGDIGFKKEADGTFTLGMDPYVVRNTTPAAFLEKVKEQFLVTKAQKTAGNLDLEFLSKEVIERDGKRIIRMVYQKAGA